MTKCRLIQQLTVALVVCWGVSVRAQDAATTNNLLTDAQKATGATAPAVAAPAPVTPAAPAPAPAPEPMPAPAPAPTPAPETPAPTPAPAPATPAPAPETPAAPAAPAPTPAPETPAPVPAPVPAPAAPAPAAEATPAPAPAVPATPAAPAAEAPAAPAAGAVVMPGAPVPEGVLGQPPAVPPKEVQATPADAKELQIQEELRRKALQQQADKEIKAGDQAMKDGNYLDAAKTYELSLAHLRQVATAVNLGSISNKIGEAYGRAADAARKSDATKARSYANTALGFNKDEKHAKSTLSYLEKKSGDNIVVGPVPPIHDQKIKAEKVSIHDKLVEGRQYFDLKKYDEAEGCFDKVLSVDPYNKDAMRFLRRIGDMRFELSTAEREATVTEMMNTVRDEWNPHIRKESSMAKPTITPPTLVEQTDVLRTRQKLQKLIIPQIEFKQANIADVLDYLSKSSVEVDVEDKTGVNIILKLPTAGGAAADAGAAPAAAPAADAGAAPAAPGAAAAQGTPPITLTLRKVNLLDAIKYITDIAGLSYRIDKNVVFITPRGVDPSLLITHMYPVSQALINSISEKASAAPAAPGGAAPGGAAAGGAAAVDTSASRGGDLSAFFTAAGIPFPTGTSVTYNPAISKLIVSHTPEAQEKIESILAELDVAAKQVEIEARFVDVNEDALEEFGFQWALNNNYTLASNNKYSNPSMNERIQLNKDSQGFTKALRFFNLSNSQVVRQDAVDIAGSGSSSSTTGGTAAPMPIGNILNFASVLTNPELQMSINAISQKGHADVLSSPRVTTKNSEQATIKVIEEIRYPQAYEANQIQTYGGLNATAGAIVNTTPINVTVFTPADFQTREVGVILNVTPTIGPDGYTIDLTLVPEVSSLAEWHQYGTQNGLNAAQPFFMNRTVTSKMVVWDGETVVLGGMIKETLTDFEDKIPFLGDIPLLGVLFRSKGTSSARQNLMIFVTARIVDSSGRPVHKKERPTLTGGGGKAGTETKTVVPVAP